MTVYYVDYEGAAGTGDGSSFANRAKRAGDIWPSSSSTRASAGDVIRVKQSPNPTVLGTGKVDQCPARYSYGYTSKSYSSQVVYSTTTGETRIDIGYGYKTGDRIAIYDNQQSASSAVAAGKSISGIWSITADSSNAGWWKLDGFTPSNANSESSGNFKYAPLTAETIKLSGTPPWKNIASHACMRDAWTGISGVTTTHNIAWSDWNSSQTWIHVNGSDKIEIPQNGTTGKQAYYELPNTLDLSGYQQISFMVRYYGANRNNAPDVTLELCTDTTGDTSVHSIQFQPYGCWSDGWVPTVKDFGTNLNSAIKSVAIYCSDTSFGGGERFYISNIIACKASSSADSITHNSLVGLNTSSDFVWYPVQNLDERGHINLSIDNLSYRGSNFGYYSACGSYFSASNNSATIYKREPIIPYDVVNYNVSAASNRIEDFTWVNNSYDHNSQPYAVSASGAVLSCGWNSTDMSTLVGHTFIKGHGTGAGFYSGNSNAQVQRLHVFSFQNGFDVHSEGCWLEDIGGSDFYNYGFNITAGWDNRKIDIKYAFGYYSQNYYKGCCHIRGQTTKTYKHPSAPVTNFNIGWANGAGWGNSYAVRMDQCTDMEWNKINVLFTGRGIDIATQMNNCTWEEWRHGGTQQQYAVKFEDSGNKNAVNCKIKKIINEANQCGLYISNCGDGNSVDDFQSYGGDHWGWCVNPSDYHSGASSNPQYRFGRAYWSQSGMFNSNQGGYETFTILGGNTEDKVQVQKGCTLRTSDLVFGTMNQGQTEFNISNGAICLNKNYDGVSGAILNMFNGITEKITPQTAIRKTASGYALKFEGPSSADMKYNITQVVVNSGSQVTVSVWAYREDHLPSNGNGLHVQLVVKANSEIGLTSDVIATIPAYDILGDPDTHTQTWEQLQCQFTPSAAGVVTIQLRRFTNSSTYDGYGVFDDLTVSQA